MERGAEIVANDDETGKEAHLLAATREWFNDYVGALDACGRSELDDPRALLRYHAVPLLLTTDIEAMTLTTEAEVLEAVHWQIQALRVAAFHYTETLYSEMIAINATSLLQKSHLLRRRANGTEIGRVHATFLITIGAHGPRITVLAMRPG